MMIFEHITRKRIRRVSPNQRSQDAVTTTSSSSRFDTKYCIEEQLNKGVYGKVYKASHILHPEQKFAVKVIDRTKLDDQADRNVFLEVSILKELYNHEHVTKVVDFFVTDSHFYIVQPLAMGGDMFERIREHGAYDEKDARKIAITLLKTVQRLHKAGIVHRDLKPDNLLLTVDNPNSTNIVVADFGFADYLPSNNKTLTRRCGTPDWISPEILTKIPYRESVDVWSLGCIIFSMLGGYPPFYAKDQATKFQKIRDGEFKFHPKRWAGVSEEAKDLVKGMLMVNPKDRWSIDDALQSAWLKECESSESTCDTQLSYDLSQ